MTPENEAKLLATAIAVLGALNSLNGHAAALRGHVEPFLKAIDDAGGIEAVRAKWAQFAPILEKLKAFLPQ